MPRDEMLKNMTWEEFLSWSEYNSIYPFGWEQWQQTGDIISALTSSKNNRTKATDLYPWLKQVGNMNIARDNEIKDINDKGMVAISSSWLISHV